MKDPAQWTDAEVKQVRDTAPIVAASATEVEKAAYGMLSQRRGAQMPLDETQRMRDGLIDVGKQIFGNWWVPIGQVTTSVKTPLTAEEAAALAYVDGWLATMESKGLKDHERHGVLETLKAGLLRRSS